MNDARETILASIRRSLARAGPDASASARLDARLREPLPNLLPRVDDDLVEGFLAKAKELGMTVARVARLDEAPAAVAQYMAVQELRPRLVVAPAISDLPWPPGLELRAGPAGPEDLASATPCYAAIAETGSLVLLSGDHSPSTLYFVPDDHIVILEADQVVRHAEDVWARVRRDHAALPRVINVISGPSRTADIEQVLQLGVHGPRRLHVVLVDSGR